MFHAGLVQDPRRTPGLPGGGQCGGVMRRDLPGPGSLLLGGAPDGEDGHVVRICCSGSAFADLVEQVLRGAGSGSEQGNLVNGGQGAVVQVKDAVTEADAGPLPITSLTSPRVNTRGSKRRPHEGRAANLPVLTGAGGTTLRGASAGTLAWRAAEFRALPAPGDSYGRHADSQQLYRGAVAAESM